MYAVSECNRYLRSLTDRRRKYEIFRAAISTGNVDLVEELVSIDFDIRSIEKSGSVSFLAQAVNASSHRVELVNYLLNAGSDPTFEGLEGKRPDYFAIEAGEIQLARKIVAHSKKPDALYRSINLIAAVKANQLPFTLELLRHGADPNVQEETGATSLTYAVVLKRIELVRLLREFGADCSIQGAHGQTPLKAANDDPQLLRALSCTIP